MPWHLSADLRRFRRLTMSHHIIMGRKTFESIGRPLPGRTSVVVTRNPAYQAAEALVAPSLDAAMQIAAGDTEPFIIGGAQIYRLALPRVERIYLTRVHAQIPGDTHFPEWNEQAWTLVEQQDHPSEQPDGPAFRFESYELKRDG